MSLLRTLSVTPTFDVVRRSNTFTSIAKFDTGAMHVFNRGARALYSFELKLEPMYRGAMEQLEMLHQFLKGGRAFLYDGGPYASVQNFYTFAEGDGSRTQFFLPNRYIASVMSGGALGTYVSSLQIQTQNQVTLATSSWGSGNYSLTAVPGILNFNTATPTTPNSGHDIQAIYSCNYRCLFDPVGFQANEIAKGIFRVQLNINEVPFYVGS